MSFSKLLPYNVFDELVAPFSRNLNLALNSFFGMTFEYFRKIFRGSVKPLFVEMWLIEPKRAQKNKNTPFMNVS
jgi:hypothetical protein